MRLELGLLHVSIVGSHAFTAGGAAEAFSGRGCGSTDTFRRTNSLSVVQLWPVAGTADHVRTQLLLAGAGCSLVFFSRQLSWYLKRKHQSHSFKNKTSVVRNSRLRSRCRQVANSTKQRCLTSNWSATWRTGRNITRIRKRHTRNSQWI